MDLIVLVVMLAAIAFVVWLATTKIPMHPVWATSIQVIALILVVLWLLRYFAVLPNVLTR